MTELFLELRRLRLSENTVSDSCVLLFLKEKIFLDHAPYPLISPLIEISIFMREANMRHVLYMKQCQVFDCLFSSVVACSKIIFFFDIKTDCN